MNTELNDNEHRESFSRMVLLAKLNELRRKENLMKSEWERNLRLSLLNHWYLSAISVSFMSLFDYAAKMLKEEKSEVRNFPFGDISKVIEMQRSQFANSFRYSSAEGGLFSYIDQLNTGLRNRFIELFSGLKKITDDVQLEIDTRSQFYTAIQNDLDILSQSNTRAVSFLNQLSGQFQLPANAFMGLARMMGSDPDDVTDSPAMKKLTENLNRISGISSDWTRYQELENSEYLPQLRLFEPQDWINDVLGEFMEIAVDQDVEIFYSIPSDMPELLGDMVIARQMLSNLLDGAICSSSIDSGNESPGKFRFKVEVLGDTDNPSLNFSVSELRNTEFLKFIHQLKGQPGEPAFKGSVAGVRFLFLQCQAWKTNSQFFASDDGDKGCSIGFSFNFANGKIFE